MAVQSAAGRIGFALPTVRPTIVRLEDWLSLRARTHGDRPAVVAGGRLITYSALDRVTARTARRLAALGVGRGDRIATTLPPGTELVALLHAAARLGSVLAPLDTRLTAGERRAQLEGIGARLVIDAPPEGDEVEAVAPTAIDPGSPWTVLFSSGTGGAPKPVLLTHRNHLASALASAWMLGVAPDDRWLCALPLFHVGGLAILVRAVVHGTAVELHERFEPERAVAAIAAGRVTLVSLVPTMLRRLADGGLGPSTRLRAVLVGGAATPPGLVDWARDRGLPLVRTYGMTETASHVAAASGDDRGARPLPGVDLRIGAGEEILARGPMVAPAELASDGWLHTGDRGRIDEEGLLHVLGRLDEVIVTGGEKVAAEEVEHAMLEHPAVAEAAVAALPHPEWGDAVAAWVVPRRGARLGAEDLLRHCRSRLAAFKLPKQVHFVSALPRNASGKVVRRRLQRRDAAGEGRSRRAS